MISTKEFDDICHVARKHNVTKVYWSNQSFEVLFAEEEKPRIQTTTPTSIEGMPTEDEMLMWSADNYLETEVKV